MTGVMPYRVVFQIALLSGVVLMVLPVCGCGLVSTQSVYEGFRTQQRIKDAGTLPGPDALGSYDAYQKGRDKAKSAPPEPAAAESP
ncbi:MAG: hypothetical protein EBR18_00050 [Betaproteobacteria bacterium]|nr:hypothetical protein [Betaproteobacteria bacterium]